MSISRKAHEETLEKTHEVIQIEDRKHFPFPCLADFWYCTSERKMRKTEITNYILLILGHFLWEQFTYY